MTTYNTMGHDIPLTWGLTRHLAEKFASPTDISSAIVMSEMLAQQGQVYDGPFRMNEINAVTLLGLSLRFSGHDVDDDTVGQRIFDEGAGAVIDDAISLIVAMVSGKEADETAKGDQPKKQQPRQTGKKS